jgi:undecaprenyl-diphosphatase
MAVRRRIDAVAVAVGLVLLVAGMIVVGDDGHVPAAEEALFRSVNDWPDWLIWPLWPFQQAGNVVVGPLLAALAWWLHRRRLAVALLAATVAKLALERVVKALVTRERPGTAVGLDIHLRGDVSATGESFVSGHLVVITAVAWMITPYLPRRWVWVPWVVVAMVGLTRTYVGAHLPLDVVCGGGLGLIIGGTANLVAGVPEAAEVSEPAAPRRR